MLQWQLCRQATLPNQQPLKLPPQQRARMLRKILNNKVRINHLYKQGANRPAGLLAPCFLILILAFAGLGFTSFASDKYLYIGTGIVMFILFSIVAIIIN